MMAHDPSLYAGGAALNALDEQENIQFNRHLADCPTCLAELTGFQETAARLGAASAETPPASMRAAVLARIAVTRQLPPEVAHLADDDSTELDLDPSPAPADRPRGTSSFPTIPEQGLAEVIDLSSRRRVTHRILLSVAAAVAIALVAVSAVFLLDRGNSNQNALRQCVDTATDQHSLAAAAGSTGVSAVTVSASCGAALVRMSDVPSAGPGKTYQLWVLTRDQFRSVTTMEPDADGTMPDTVAAVHIGDTALGVTVEPAGGSAKPTTPPVITVPLTV